MYDVSWVSFSGSVGQGSMPVADCLLCESVVTGLKYRVSSSADVKLKNKQDKNRTSQKGTSHESQRKLNVDDDRASNHPPCTQSLARRPGSAAPRSRSSSQCKSVIAAQYKSVTAAHQRHRQFQYTIYIHTHTHTHTRLTALCPGLPG